MKFASAVDYLYQNWIEARASGRSLETVCILGPPGIGKTTIAKEVHARMLGQDPNAVCVIKDLTTIFPEDFGYPRIVDVGEGRAVVQHVPLEWMLKLSQPNATGVLVLDDLTAADPATAKAVRQLVLFRNINDIKLAPGVLVIVTGNRPQDGANAAPLPSHFVNAVCSLTIEMTLSDWAPWFMSVGGHHSILGFLNHKPDFFVQIPSQRSSNGAFATPRSWAMLSNQMKLAIAQDKVMEIASGFVGEGVAGEFIAYMAEMSNLPAVESVLDNPEQTIPDPAAVFTSPDRLVGMCVGLAYKVVERIRNTPKPARAEHVCAYLKALCWIVQGKGEYIAMSTSAYSQVGGLNDPFEKGAILFKQRHPEHVDFLTQLRKSA